MFTRGSPYKTAHIATLWALTTTVYLTGKLLSGPHVTYITTVWAFIIIGYLTGKQLSGFHVYKGYTYKTTHINTV